DALSWLFPLISPIKFSKLKLGIKLQIGGSIFGAN
ncbi:MAG: hypothetical protein ACI808_002619, partial [Paraglaciecola sp.]